MLVKDLEDFKKLNGLDVAIYEKIHEIFKEEIADDEDVRRIEKNVERSLKRFNNIDKASETTAYVVEKTKHYFYVYTNYYLFFYLLGKIERKKSEIEIFNIVRDLEWDIKQYCVSKKLMFKTLGTYFYFHLDESKDENKGILNLVDKLIQER